MKTMFATAALVAAITAGAGSSGLAQSIPEGQSCGGLLCDMGVFGHKTEPAVPKAPPPAPVAPRVEATQSPAASPDIEPKPRAIRKKRRVAKAAPAMAGKPVAEAGKPSQSRRPTESPSAPRPVAVKQVAQPVPASAAPVQPTAILDPFSQVKATAPFRPLY